MDKLKPRKNVIGALGIIMITAIYLSQAVKLRFGSVTSPGPAFMPIIVSVFILTLCVYSIAKGLFFSSEKNGPEIDLWEEESPNVAAGSGVDERKAVLYMAVLVIYALVLDKIGFIISTSLLTYFSLRLMKYKNWLVCLIATAVIVGIVYFVFDNWLRIRFPTGSWL